VRRIVWRYGGVQLQAPVAPGTTIEAAYRAGLKHIEETLNLKAYADYRPVGSEPHPTMSGMGTWSYSYKAQAR
jgi:hypothetical protein